MTPDHRPTNDNQSPAQAERWEETPQGRRVMNVVSAVVIVIIWGSALLWMDAAHWRAFGIIMGVAIVCMLVAAIWRLIVTGRA